MSSVSSTTWPATRAPRCTACMRLRQRISVDLPQPDGPMIAVIELAGTCRDTLRMACMRPYQADRPRTSIEWAGVDVSVTGRAFVGSVRRLGAHLPARRYKARQQAEDGNDAD